MKGKQVMDPLAVLRACAGACLLLAGAAAPAAPAPGSPVLDPYYGQVLFDFYQQRYFSAATELEVSQQFQRLPHHADEAELLRGGLLLSYGMRHEAQAVFERLIGRMATPAVRDRAWYYLARIHHDRGDDAMAEQALGHIGGALPGGLEAQRQLLQANLRLARGDADGAAKLLAAVPADAENAPYARFNLGVALFQAGRAEEGARVLDELGRAPAAGEELQSLRDKANLALGVEALKAQDMAGAQARLERVRLQGMHASQALLGLGWAQTGSHRPERALVSWQELTTRDPGDPAVLEARLAIPYVMADMGAFASSLEGYRHAIEAYERESERLDESEAALRGGDLLDLIIAVNPGEEMGWFWRISRLPLAPHAGQLAKLLAGHRFQEALKDYRDLQSLAGNLQQWRERLATYDDMVAAQRQAYAERLPAVQTGQRAAAIQGLAQRRDRLQQELGDAVTRNDVYVLASPAERALGERLTRADETLQRLGGGAEHDAARERFRRVQGAMRWQLTQDHPQRLWDTRKQLKALDAALAAARQRDQRLTEAQRERPQQLAEFAARVAALGPRLSAQQQRLQELSAAQRAYLRQLALDQLEQQKARVAAYLVQARYAMAQIYDRSQSVGEPGGSQQP